MLVDPDDYEGVLSELRARRRLGGDPLRAREEGVRPYRGLRRRDRQLPFVPGRRVSRDAARCSCRSARTCATARTRTSAPRSIATRTRSAGSLASYRQLQGKELSYNNIADADAAWECVKSFAEPACVIVKHANPCGAAIAGELLEAYEKAFRCDPVSAFGGILAFNRALDRRTAEALGRQFAEVIIAPRVEPEAQNELAAKANLRVLEVPMSHEVQAHDYKRVGGGLLVQTSDAEL